MLVSESVAQAYIFENRVKQIVIDNVVDIIHAEQEVIDCVCDWGVNLIQNLAYVCVLGTYKEKMKGVFTVVAAVAVFWLDDSHHEEVVFQWAAAKSHSSQYSWPFPVTLVESLWYPFVIFL